MNTNINCKVTLYDTGMLGSKKKSLGQGVCVVR